MLRESGISFEQATKALLFAMVIAVIGVAEFNYHEPWAIFDTILGGLMAFIGMGMLLVSYTRPITFTSLGALYMALAVFYFGYVRHYPEWDNTASWLPTLMGIAAFGWIALNGGDTQELNT